MDSLRSVNMRSKTSLLHAAALIAALVVVAPGVVVAAPTIGAISDNGEAYPNSAVPRFERYEATFQISDVGAAFTDYNPFNPNLVSLGGEYYNKKGILVDAILRTPDGATIEWPCFWYEGADGSRSWRLRFAPTAAGEWSYHVRVNYGADTVNSDTRTFVCANGSEHGFIEINPKDGRFFRFTDGTSFYPIGTDISGYSMGGSVADEAFPRMKANGANFTRVFFTSLNIEPSDINRNGSVESLNNYSMSRARSVDSMMDTAHANDIRVIWTLDDWTYIKDGANQYIRVSGRDAPCADEWLSASTS